MSDKHAKELVCNDKNILDSIALNLFKKYLQIPTVHPDIDYEPCIEFFRNYANELQLPCKVLTLEPKKPIIIITWKGTDESLPGILLNSHMDVVPVVEDTWTHPPFNAEEHNGKIYARGAQDMKCVGVKYLEAIRRLKIRGETPARSVHISFVPDEEIGGERGMGLLVKSAHFKNLNIGFALDEGIASTSEKFLVFYGERTMWHVIFHCPGQPGHGSLLPENTAAEKVRYLLDQILDYRKSQQALLKSDSALTIGDVMSLNVTMMSGGVQTNVLPSELTFTLDCRIPVTVNVQEWKRQLENWCREAGEGVYIEGDPFSNGDPTVLDESNCFWTAFRESSKSLGLKIETRIFPGGTDSRYLREVGIPALGFSPITDHPVLLHDNDEYLTVNAFLNGIEIYEEIVKSIANII